MSCSLSEAIRSRRSVKDVLSEGVPRDVLKKMLEAAKWAPSAHNAQPWRFIVITDSKTKQELAETMAHAWAEDMTVNGISPIVQNRLTKDSTRRFTDAPVLIVACITMEDMDEYPDERRQKNERVMATQSLAAAVQNMLLAAHSEGLGSCWFCAPLFCQDAVRRVLRIPRNVEPQALITLGLPSGRVDPPPRKPLKEVVFRDYWGEEF